MAVSAEHPSSRSSKYQSTRNVSDPSSTIPTTNEQPCFVTDEAGNRIAVIIDADRYEELVEALEELEEIRAFDEAKATDDEAVPFQQAVEEIERARA